MNGQPGLGPLVTLRIIWAALLMGQVAFLCVVMIVAGNQAPPDPHMMRIMFLVLLGMLIVMVPSGLIVRSIIYGGGRQPDGSITPAAYATGNIIFYAMCEGVGFFGLVCTMMNRGFGPHTIVALTAMGILLVSFPRGNA